MSFTGTLLPYQEDAVDKMTDRHKVLVAYDLGLGKTVLTICAIEELREAGQLTKTALVVCLSSLKYQWKKEIEKFSTETALVIEGTKGQRLSQYVTAGDYSYVIVNYEQVVNDWDLVKHLEIDALIMDEATAIKSFRSKRSKKVKELSRGVDIRFALTGTPIENGRPEELYSIMQSVDPTVLGQRFDLFDATFIVRNKFGGVDRYRNLAKLHERVMTASVRKSQSDPDVAPFLPETIHKDPVVIPFDRNSSIVYRKISNDLAEELSDAQASFGSGWSIDSHYGHGATTGGPEDALRGSIMSKVTSLRMLCDHPALLTKSASLWSPYGTEGSKYLAELLDDKKIAATLAKSKSPKLDVLSSLVADHLSSDDANKVVIFCSYVLMADLIQEQTGGVVYTGAMNAVKKEEAKVKFQTDPDTRVLVSTDAGGYGVDLPQANMLVNFDLPWSSGLSVQRNGRIKRASSRWPSVVIQDLLMSESIEERQFEVLHQKSAVASAVIDGKGINTRGGVDMTAGSLIGFLSENQP